MNAKNSMGGYVGSKRFIYTALLKDGAILPEDRPEDKAEDLKLSGFWKTQCGDGTEKELKEVTAKMEVIGNQLEAIYDEAQRLETGLKAGVIDYGTYQARKNGINKKVEQVMAEYQKIADDYTIYK